MRAKLGLKNSKDEDAKLIQNLEECILLSETDMTIFYRELSNFKKDNANDGVTIVKKAFYFPDDISNEKKSQWNEWFQDYNNRLKSENLSDEERQSHMNSVNPKYVLRNYMAQLAIDKANEADYTW